MAAPTGTEEGKGTGPSPRTGGLSNWFAEMKRRRVIRALIGYGIAAFAVLQIIEPIMHALHWPETVLSYVVAALAAGFPVVISLAWIFDVKGGRIQRTAPAVGATGPRGVRLALLLVGLGVLAGAPGLGWYFILARGARTGAAIKSLIVLPFVNSSGNADAEYLSDGITEGLINSLSQVRELQVIARTTAFKYKGKEVDFGKLGRDLSIDAVLTGRVQQLPDSLVVQADLVNVHTGSQLWGERYDRKLTDTSSMQQELTRAILEKLRPRLTVEEQRRITKRETANPEAYQLYLRGLYFRRQYTKDGSEKSIDYFQHAIKLDPQYAIAYAALSSAYNSLAYHQDWPREEAISKAEAAARKALALDEELPEAHGELGFIQLQNWNWSSAEAEFKRAIALNPNDAGARNEYGLYLSFIGHDEEALAQYTHVRQLDPVRESGPVNVGLTLCRMGQYDRGIRTIKEAHELYPKSAFPHLALALICYGPMQMNVEAMDEARKAVALEPSNPIFQGNLGWFCAQHGDKAEAVGILEKLRKWDEGQDVAVFIATVYTGLGDHDSAIAWLEKAYQRHSNLAIWLLIHPHFNALRSDPRFVDLLRRIGFPQ